MALQLAKKLDQNPREIKEFNQRSDFRVGYNSKVDVAGPGFLNFYINIDVKQEVILDILRNCNKFGANNTGNGAKILLNLFQQTPPVLCMLVMVGERLWSVASEYPRGMWV